MVTAIQSFTGKISEEDTARQKVHKTEINK